MQALSERRQRLLALALLIAAVGLIALLVILPVAGGFHDRALQRDLLLAIYARDDRIIGELPSIIRASTTQRREQPRFQLSASSEAAAVVALTERVGGAVSAVGGTLVGVENLAASPGTVRARAEARLTTAQAATFLERLQNGAPLLTVDALVIDANVGEADTHPGLLDVRVEVSAVFPAAAPR